MVELLKDHYGKLLGSLGWVFGAVMAIFTVDSGDRMTALQAFGAVCAGVVWLGMVSWPFVDAWRLRKRHKGDIQDQEAKRRDLIPTGLHGFVSISMGPWSDNRALHFVVRNHNMAHDILLTGGSITTNDGKSKFEVSDKNIFPIRISRATPDGSQGMYPVIVVAVVQEVHPAPFQLTVRFMIEIDNGTKQAQEQKFDFAIPVKPDQPVTLP